MSQCTATSKRTGNRCGSGAIPGGTVCKHHGGAAPQVREAARLRLLAMVDPVLVELEKIALSGTQESTKLAAIRDVLDRAGLGATQKVETEVTVLDTREALLRRAEEILAEADA